MSGAVDPRARALAQELLERASAWLEAERAEGRYHPVLARDTGGLAASIGLEAVRAAAARLLEEAPLETFPAARVSDVDGLEAREPNRAIPAGGDLDFEYPRYQDAWVRGYLANFEDEHVAHALAGRDEAARAACRTELDWEEYLAVVAYRHDFDVVSAHLGETALPRERSLTPRLVLAVESSRAGAHDLSERTLRALLAECSAWECVQLAAGYLGRIPWTGYPFPDY